MYCIIGESSYNIQSYQKRYGVGKHVVLCKTTEGNVDHLLLLFFFWIGNKNFIDKKSTMCL